MDPIVPPAPGAHEPVPAVRDARGLYRSVHGDATVLGVADTYGIELLHPAREGRGAAQIGKKGLSNKRWIVGGKLGLVLNKWGLVCAWDAATANVSDVHFRRWSGGSTSG